MPGSGSLDAGFQILRQGKHIVMSNGERFVTMPRHNPIKAFTMGGIVKDAGLTVKAFRKYHCIYQGREVVSKILIFDAEGSFQLP